MQATPPQHRASITAPKRVGDLLRRLDTCEDSFQVAYALRLAPLVFMRPGNMHGAEWQEINVEAADWRIPLARMRMKTRHVVPLSTQALTLLRELYPFSGEAKLGSLIVSREIMPNVCRNKAETAVDSATPLASVVIE